MELKNKVAVITGAGRGIGKAVSLMLAEEGCLIVGVARSGNELEKLVDEIEKSDGKAEAIPTDLADMKNAKALISRVKDSFGGIDILINNAGIITPKPFMEVTEEEFDQTVNINLKSMFFLCQEALKIMKQKHGGYIINISSTVALGVPAHLSTYGISKCGVVGLSQALYETAKEYGVKVSVIYPGITDTKMVRDINPPTKPQQWMQPRDIAESILFLLKQSERVVVKDVVPWSTGYDKI